MKKAFLVLLIVGGVSLFVIGFFFNPWTQKASFYINEPGPQVAYVSYTIIPRMRSLYPGAFPTFFTIDNDSEGEPTLVYDCRYFDIKLVGIFIIGHCLENGESRVAFVWDLVDFEDSKSITTTAHPANLIYQDVLTSPDNNLYELQKRLYDDNRVHVFGDPVLVKNIKGIHPFCRGDSEFRVCEIRPGKVSGTWNGVYWLEYLEPGDTLSLFLLEEHPYPVLIVRNYQKNEERSIIVGFSGGRASMVESTFVNNADD